MENNYIQVKSIKYYTIGMFIWWWHHTNWRDIICVPIKDKLLLEINTFWFRSPNTAAFVPWHRNNSFNWSDSGCNSSYISFMSYQCCSKLINHLRKIWRKKILSIKLPPQSTPIKIECMWIRGKLKISMTFCENTVFATFNLQKKSWL